MEIRKVFFAASIADWFLIIPPVFIVIGISLLKRRAWVLLIIYSLYSILINSYISIMMPSDYNLGALGQALFSMVSFAYFMQDELRNAFFKKGFKGWRNSERHALKMDINVNGIDCKAVNLSPGGCAVEWPDCHLKIGMPVLVTFQLRKKIFTIKGRVVRNAPSGEVGVSFVNIEAGTEKVLRELLTGVL